MRLRTLRSHPASLTAKMPFVVRLFKAIPAF